MPKNHSLLLLMFLLILPCFGYSQYFSVGQDQGKLSWKVIHTAHFSIVYPADYEQEAQRVAQKFETVYDHSGSTLGHKPGKITVVIHSKSLNSNGFVAWAPARVELFTTPNQDSYAQEWIDQLAIHELRHHIQIDKIEQELPEIFNLLLGEQAASLVIGAYLPFWFLEGDAVVAETALSRSGRGRLSSFAMELKAQIDEKGIYSFDKAYLGSYRDYVPDYYQLGYQMVSNIRNQNGGEVWAKVLHHIARNPLSLNALSQGLKKATGKTQDEYYTSIMQNLGNSHPFNFNAAGDTLLKGSTIVATKKSYESYRYPQAINDTTYIALKSTLSELPSFVLINQNYREKKLFTPGAILEESVDYRLGKLIWMEAKPDLRWAHKDRSLLRLLNIGNNHLQEYCFDAKMVAPIISPDGQCLAAIKYDESNAASIVLMKAADFNIVKEIRSPLHHTLLNPSWSNDGKAIYAIDLGLEGKSIVRITLATGSYELLSQPVYGEISRPFEAEGFLYFISNQKGKNEGYKLDLLNSNKYRILTTRYGIRDLKSSFNGTKLVFSEYSSFGFKPATRERSKKEELIPVETGWFQDSLANQLTRQEVGIIDLSVKDTAFYASQKYIKSAHLIKVHSWAPAYVDADNSTVNAGFSMASQNILSTAITQFGYKYSSVSQSGKWIGKIEYAGWYPIFRFYGDFGNEHSSYLQINKHFNSHNVLIGQDTVTVKFTQQVVNMHLDASIPLNFTKGKMYRMLEPEVQIGYSHNWQQATIPSFIFRGSYIPFTYRLYGHNLKQQSLRDIQPGWGQIVDLQFRHTPLGDRQLGNILATEGTFYFPGLTKNHGIRLYLGYQLKNSDGRFFSDLINYPRGYTSIENCGLQVIKGDYVLPIAYPDLKITRLYYLKRISLRLFYDWSQFTLPVAHSSDRIFKTFSSIGGELMTECHLLRFIAPLRIGIRESYLNESRQLTSEFLLSIYLKSL